MRTWSLRVLGRHQLGVLRRSVKRPKLTSADRFLWAWLCSVWNDWRSATFIINNRDWLAQERVPAVLDLEDPTWQAGAASRAEGRPRFDSCNEP
jgi:hypothetical protein